jgi:hypothetical protein
MLQAFIQKIIKKFPAFMEPGSSQELAIGSCLEQAAFNPSLIF